MHSCLYNQTRFLIAALVGLSALLSAGFGWAAASGVSHDYELTTEDEVLKFSITLPADWDVLKDSGGFELFAEPKVKAVPTPANPVVADPNITVTASRNPMPIDEQALEPYAQQIILGLQRTLGDEAGLEVFLKRIVDVGESRQGLLYYLRYKKGSFDVFNAVLVISSASHIFRVTLTDYQTTFDKNLETLFPFMASIDIGPTQLKRPSLSEILTPWIAGFLGLTVCFFLGRLLMRRLASSRFSEDLSESMDEVKYSVHPLTSGRGNQQENFDSSFGRSSEASRFEGGTDLTEVPLSQAVAASSVSAHSHRGSAFSDVQLSNASAAPGRSVTDPESEFGELSAIPAPSRTAPKSNRSASRAAKDYPPDSEFGFTRSPDDDKN
jgi:hypothetical protein